MEDQKEVQACSTEKVTTTMMIRNVPRKYTSAALTHELQETLPVSSFNFVYLPWDSKASTNLGYGFVNFVTPEAALDAQASLDGQTWRLVKSNKSIKLVPANRQGLEDNVRQYLSNTSHTDKKFRPVVIIDEQEMDIHDAAVILLGADATAALIAEAEANAEAAATAAAAAAAAVAAAAPQSASGQAPSGAATVPSTGGQTSFEASTPSAKAQARAQAPRKTAPQSADTDTNWRTSTKDSLPPPPRTLSKDRPSVEELLQQRLQQYQRQWHQQPEPMMRQTSQLSQSSQSPSDAGTARQPKAKNSKWHSWPQSSRLTNPRSSSPQPQMVMESIASSAWAVSEDYEYDSMDYADSSAGWASAQATGGRFPGAMPSVPQAWAHAPGSFGSHSGRDVLHENFNLAGGQNWISPASTAAEMPPSLSPEGAAAPPLHGHAIGCDTAATYDIMSMGVDAQGGVDASEAWIQASGDRHESARAVVLQSPGFKRASSTVNALLLRLQQGQAKQQQRLQQQLQQGSQPGSIAL